MVLLAKNHFFVALISASALAAPVLNTHGRDSRPSEVARSTIDRGFAKHSRSFSDLSPRKEQNIQLPPKKPARPTPQQAQRAEEVGRQLGSQLTVIIQRFNAFRGACLDGYMASVGQIRKVAGEVLRLVQQYEQIVEDFRLELGTVAPPARPNPDLEAIKLAVNKALKNIEGMDEGMYPGQTLFEGQKPSGSASSQ